MQSYSAWDLDGDGQFDDYFGRFGSAVLDRGGTFDIAVRVTDGDGGATTHGQSVTVVPEPASLAMLATGLAAPALLRWRR